ncbi:hypothetical protein M7I_4912 [Glarea lozoyensis 74030]|uniref:Uncharacterized protein n=1 Tax=Glarea lozoyensis (strain ATCC 74030 / MF5533) TaxID=1104152 RepID=H0EQG3_GLAL7|nr:hypothetical protein M7I_4912 [Glarea lozoyensis 74030]
MGSPEYYCQARQTAWTFEYYERRQTAFKIFFPQFF